MDVVKTSSKMKMQGNVYETFALVQRTFFRKMGVANALQASEGRSRKRNRTPLISTVQPSIFCLATTLHKKHLSTSEHT